MPWPLLPAIRIPGFSNAFYNAIESVYRCLSAPVPAIYVRICTNSTRFLGEKRKGGVGSR